MDSETINNALKRRIEKVANKRGQRLHQIRYKGTSPVSDYFVEEVIDSPIGRGYDYVSINHDNFPYEFELSIDRDIIEEVDINDVRQIQKWFDNNFDDIELTVQETQLDEDYLVLIKGVIENSLEISEEAEKAIRSAFKFMQPAKLTITASKTFNMRTINGSIDDLILFMTEYADDEPEIVAAIESMLAAKRLIIAYSQRTLNTPYRSMKRRGLDNIEPLGVANSAWTMSNRLFTEFENFWDSSDAEKIYNNLSSYIDDDILSKDVQKELTISRILISKLGDALSDMKDAIAKDIELYEEFE